jgi:hypothetical protein
MEEDYDPQRESKIIRRLSKMAYGCIVVGGTIMFGGSHYYTTPSMSPELRRYHEIGIVLDNPPKVRSGDLESKSAELIAGINILKAEKDEITSKSDFAEARKRYEFEKEKADSRKDYSF